MYATSSISAYALRSALAIGGVMMTLASLPLRAQDALPGAVTLTVHDSIGQGIVGAAVEVQGTDIKGTTDAQGQIRFTAVRMGQTTLLIRRLGFSPASAVVNVDPRVPAVAEVTLTRIVQHLSPIVIRGTAAEYTGRLAGFYRRRQMGNGHFLTVAEIEKYHSSQFSDVMRRIPGVRIVSTRMIPRAVRFRANDTGCWPLVWLDGSPLPSGEFDVDFISPSTVQALEVYSSVATIPPEFMGARGLGSCGVIVIWSKEGQLKPKKSKKQVTAAELAELVNSLKVFTADQVDVTVQPDSSSPVALAYPEELFVQQIGGHATVEFVVAVTGEVEMETFGVISSTHPLFTRSVRAALEDATFIPAVKDGRKVRQVVQWPVTFEMDSSMVRPNDG